MESFYQHTHGHGMKGRNIPCDLRMEHINRLCKDAVYALQASKTASAIVRVGKSLEPLSHLLEQFDKIMLECQLEPTTNQASAKIET